MATNEHLNTANAIVSAIDPSCHGLYYKANVLLQCSYCPMQYEPCCVLVLVMCSKWLIDSSVQLKVVPLLLECGLSIWLLLECARIGYKEAAYCSWPFQV
ncbi:hypothetical protein U1Q18_024753 [Sarracenia purpurea var. burkii]